MGNETQALEVTYREKTRVGGIGDSLRELGSCVPRDGEQSTTAKRTWEKVWAHRRSKAPLLGRVRGGGADYHRNLPAHACTGSQRAGHLWFRLWLARSHLLGL